MSVGPKPGDLKSTRPAPCERNDSRRHVPQHTFASLLNANRAGVLRRYSISYAFAVFHFPFVKSGNSTGVLPPATDFSESGEMALLVTESYTSQSGMRLLRRAATNRSQLTGVTVAPPPWPRIAAFR